MATLFDLGIRRNGLRYRWHCGECGDHQGLIWGEKDPTLKRDGGWTDLKQAASGLIEHHKSGGTTQHRPEGGILPLISQRLQAVLDMPDAS